MNRRGFFAKGTALAAASAFPAPAVAQGTRRWKLATAWPKNFPGLGTGARRLADAVTAMSGGRLEVKLYAAGEIVPPLEILDAVGAGTVEMGHVAAGYWVGKNRSLAFFAVVPAGLTAQEHNAWIAFGGGQALWDEAYAPYGVKAFPAGNTGTQMGGWFNREITSLDDFEGLRMRIPGLAGEVVNRAGGLAVNIPGAEIMTSLQSGVVDAVEFAGPWTDLAFGFHKVARHYYGPGFHEPAGGLELMINRGLWEDLPTDLQAIVRHAAASENARILSEFTAGNAAALETLVRDHGVKPKQMPAPVIRTLRKISAEVVAETAALGDLNRRIYESWSAFRDRVAALAPFAEKGALDQRDL